jgi:hypothetical protein
MRRIGWLKPIELSLITGGSLLVLVLQGSCHLINGEGFILCLLLMNGVLVGIVV